MVWLLWGKPGGGIRGIASCYTNSALFSGHKPSSKATGFSWAVFSPISVAMSHPESLCVTSYQVCSEQLGLAGPLLVSNSTKPLQLGWLHTGGFTGVSAQFWRLFSDKAPVMKLPGTPPRARHLVAHWDLKSPFNGILTPLRHTQQYGLAFFVSILLLSTGELGISAVCFSR